MKQEKDITKEGKPDSAKDITKEGKPDSATEDKTKMMKIILFNKNSQIEYMYVPYNIAAFCIPKHRSCSN